MSSILLRLSKHPRTRQALIVLGVFLALFLLVNLVIMPLYVSRGGTLPVPDVTGLDLSTAKSTLQAVGLEPVEAETRPDPQKPVGTVVFQNPQSQSVVKHGRRIYLTVSGGEMQVTTPLLRGKSLRDAKFTIERSGLVVGSVGYEHSDQYPEGTIIAQSVGADLRLPKGSRVNLTVSMGSTGGGVPVPDVVGRTLSEAEKILAQSDLKVGNITYQQNYELIPNTVVEQFPRPGESTAAGRAIDLFVVKAGKPAEEIKAPKQ
jgi:eukaryotic-like serine/threonine-protein kinase